MRKLPIGFISTYYVPRYLNSSYQIVFSILWININSNRWCFRPSGSFILSLIYFTHNIFTAFECSIEYGKRSSLNLTFSRRRSLSHGNQSIDLQSKSMDWFLYNDGLRLERVKSSYIKGNPAFLLFP